MTKYDIVAEMARDKAVETMVANIAHQALTPDLRDLCQMVYVILLEYDDNKIVELWQSHQMQFFISRIITNQYRSSNSPYHSLFRKHQEKSEDITGKDFIDEE